MGGHMNEGSPVEHLLARALEKCFISFVDAT